MVVIFFVGLDDLGGAVGGVVVDDDDSIVALCSLQEGIEGGPDALRIVVDRYDYGYSGVCPMGHSDSDVSTSVDMPV